MVNCKNKKYYAELKIAVKEIFYKNNSLYGAPRITKVLKSMGYKIAKKTVAKIMKELSLISIYNKSYKVNTPHKKYKKIKDMHSCIPHAPKNICEVWTIDDTAFIINNTTYHLYSVLDDFSRRVLAYNLSLEYNAKQVIRTIKYSLKNRRPNKRIILRMDNDVIYNDEKFICFTKEYEKDFKYLHCPIYRSYNYNSHHEAWHAIIKKECINYIMHYASKEDVKNTIRKYIYFYNNIRFHSSLSYMSPVEYELSLFVDNKHKVIMHIDYNKFYASCEALLDKNLKNKPVAVVAPDGYMKSLIVCANDIAKRFGVKCGDFVYDAKSKCNDINIIRNPHKNFYKKMSDIAFDTYKKYTDRIEKLGLDECFLDITNSIKLYGHPLDIAFKIQDEIYEKTKLTTSVGLSFNIDFSKIASDMLKPHGVVSIPYSLKDEICDNLSPNVFMDIGKKREKILYDHNIKNIYDLKNADSYKIASLLGENFGKKIKQRALGMGIPNIKHFSYADDKKSYSKTMILKKGTNSFLPLKEMCVLLSDKLFMHLYDKQLKAKTFKIEFLLGNDIIKEKQITLPYYVNDSKNIENALLKIIDDFVKENENCVIKKIRGEALNFIKCVDSEKTFYLKSFYLNMLLDKAIYSIRKKYNTNSLLYAFEIEPKVDYIKNMRFF